MRRPAPPATRPVERKTRSGSDSVSPHAVENPHGADRHGKGRRQEFPAAAAHARHVRKVHLRDDALPGPVEPRGRAAGVRHRLILSCVQLAAAEVVRLITWRRPDRDRTERATAGRTGLQFGRRGAAIMTAARTARLVAFAAKSLRKTMCCQRGTGCQKPQDSVRSSRHVVLPHRNCTRAGVRRFASTALPAPARPFGWRHPMAVATQPARAHPVSIARPRRDS